MLVLKKSLTVVFAFLCNGMAISLFILSGFGLDSVTPESDLQLRVAFFIIACLSLAFAVALYLSVHFGISAADMIPVIVSDKARRQFRWCKVAFDITVIIIGILLGGTFGVGSIIAGFVTGPTIQFFRRNLEKRFGGVCE